LLGLGQLGEGAVSVLLQQPLPSMRPGRPFTSAGSAYMRAGAANCLLPSGVTTSFRPLR
jgi:hypothetical protein